MKAIFPKILSYHTGAYYIQEPSASSVVNFLDVNKGMKVLDMCASPGGKTFQISQRLSDDDILISNDANNSRMPQLLRNIEYHGLSNVMITNETQDKLAENFPSFFDRILLDVPCSGEPPHRQRPQGWAPGRPQTRRAAHPPRHRSDRMIEIGRASCRERV